MYGISLLDDFKPMGISFHAVVVFGLGKNLLFKSVLGRCVALLLLGHIILASSNVFEMYFMNGP